MAAAAQTPSAYDKAVDPIVIHDMVEEEGMGNSIFVPAPEDTYVVTEPETEPSTEPPASTEDDPATDPAGTTISPDSHDPAGTDSTTSLPSGKGCRSALPAISVLPALAICSIAAVKQRSRTKFSNQ